MTDPTTTTTTPNRAVRSAIWVAIGALIAAALVCVVWVLVGDADGIVAKAFLTVLLLAGFAGIAILEASLAPRRPAWFAVTSMIGWVAILLIGAVMIWMPETSWAWGVGASRFIRFLLIVLIIQVALLHVRLFSKAHARYETTFTAIVTYVTIALVAILAIMLVIPLVLDEYAVFLPIYWRVVVALAILAAVGTALVPLVNLLFAPKRPRPQRAPGVYPGAYAAPPQQQWPTYADGRTPLPVMPDGSPDWNAYYTGRPTYAPQDATAFPLGPGQTAPAQTAPGQTAPAQTAPAQTAPAQTAPGHTTPGQTTPQPGYDGFPPPPPLPPTR